MKYQYILLFLLVGLFLFGCTGVSKNDGELGLISGIHAFQKTPGEISVQVLVDNSGDWKLMTAFGPSDIDKYTQAFPKLVTNALTKTCRLGNYAGENINNYYCDWWAQFYRKPVLANGDIGAEQSLFIYKIIIPKSALKPVFVDGRLKEGVFKVDLSQVNITSSIETQFPGGHVVDDPDLSLIVPSIYEPIENKSI